MKCPGCGTELEIVRGDRVEVSVCRQCEGVWLDDGELEKLKATLLPEAMQFETLGKRICPRCNRNMAVYFHELFELDRCEWCHGIYLDAGEIHLLRRLRDPQPSRPAAEPEDTFMCDYCKKPRPIAERVWIAERVVVCRACADAHRIDERVPRLQEVQRAAAELLHPAKRGRPIDITAAEVIVGILGALFDGL